MSEKKKRGPRFAYPCIGGPLDGLYATTQDFYGASSWSDRDEGIYHHLRNEYYEYNSGYGARKRIGGHPSMVFIHKSLLKPLISPKDR